MKKKHLKSLGNKIKDGIEKTAKTISNVAGGGLDNLKKTQHFLKNSIPEIRNILFTRFPDQVKGALEGALEDENKLRPLFGLAYTVFFLRFTPGPLKLLPFIIREEVFVDFCMRSKDVLLSKKFFESDQIRVVKVKKNKKEDLKEQPIIVKSKAQAVVQRISFSTEKLLKKYRKKNHEKDFNADKFNQFTCTAYYEMTDKEMVLKVSRFGRRFLAEHHIAIGDKIVIKKEQLTQLHEQKNFNKDLPELLVMKVEGKKRDSWPALYLFQPITQKNYPKDPSLNDEILQRFDS